MSDDTVVVAPYAVVLHVHDALPEVSTEDLGEEISKPVPEERDPVQAQKAPKAGVDYHRVIAEHFSTMNLTSPTVQRVTSSHHVLRCFGQALRQKVVGEVYHFSKPAVRIPQFVSHSWHGPAWKKIASLFVLKNGPAAMASGSFLALVMVVLSSLNILPGYDRLPMLEQDRTYVFGPWGICIGMLIACLVITFREPRDQVFVDVLCIHQTDWRLKLEGVLNICAFLKNSDSMLVLWDPSYVERLWCVFELAAFLKSRESGRATKLFIRPTILGTSSIASCFGLFAMQLAHTAVPWANAYYGTFFFSVFCWIGCYSIVCVWRRHYRQIDNLKTQLQNFTISKTKSNCCERGHVDAQGRKLPCDKAVLTACVRQWFGSVDAFEDNVRSGVAAALSEGLGKGGFPYPYVLAAAAPTLWGQGDFTASRLREREFYYAGVTAIIGLAYWLAAIPFLFACGGLIVHKFRHRYSPCLDTLVPVFAASFLTLVAGNGMFVLLMGLQAMLDDMLAAVLWAFVMSSSALLAWRLRSSYAEQLGL
ncbi:unnamed protein product [Symbiodinium necroappetens]|uniref:Transmembrane protein n=1 Tax=Symbiodinium necroappetens TaxID=1628268 RepID=A0A812RSQ7_9DINO|nr:unnamed protein product [Symbiodinium necroappetens]